MVRSWITHFVPLARTAATLPLDRLDSPMTIVFCCSLSRTMKAPSEDFMPETLNRSCSREEEAELTNVSWKTALRGSLPQIRVQKCSSIYCRQTRGWLRRNFVDQFLFEEHNGLLIAPGECPTEVPDTSSHIHWHYPFKLFDWHERVSYWTRKVQLVYKGP